jgi:hypothetical protein
MANTKKGNPKTNGSIRLNRVSNGQFANASSVSPDPIKSRMLSGPFFNRLNCEGDEKHGEVDCQSKNARMDIEWRGHDAQHKDQGGAESRQQPQRTGLQFGIKGRYGSRKQLRRERVRHQDDIDDQSRRRQR